MQSTLPLFPGSQGVLGALLCLPSPSWNHFAVDETAMWICPILLRRNNERRQFQLLSCLEILCWPRSSGPTVFQVRKLLTSQLLPFIINTNFTLSASMRSAHKHLLNAHCVTGMCWRPLPAWSLVRERSPERRAVTWGLFKWWFQSLWQHGHSQTVLL